MSAPGPSSASPRTWSEIAAVFLKLGATSYGGPAIVGLMQAELLDRRRWISRERFVEGLSLVNMLPGATATQLGIFLAYARGGWWGGLLGGLCFVLPGFVVMLALTIAYASLGVTPVLRGALYGLGPVVVGIFLVAVCRLARSAVMTWAQALIAGAAGVTAMVGFLGVASVMVLAGCVGLLLFYSRRPGVIAAVSGAAALAVLPALWWPSLPGSMGATGGTLNSGSLVDVGAFFFKAGAFTLGGGLTIIAFMQQQVVEQFQWLTPREFIDGLALGQLTPGPVLMLAAYVGYKVAGVAGAALAAGAVFLPSFVLMLAILPVLDRIRALAWTRAVMRGMAPAVIGVLAVSLVRIAPHALPDPLACAMLLATVAALLIWRVGAFRLIVAGALVGTLRARFFALPAAKVVRDLVA